MILTFEKSNLPGRTASLAKWGRTVVILPTGQVGDVDVMFTGVSSKGTTLFAQIVTKRSIKVVSNGFLETKDNIDAYFRDNGKVIYFTPGLLRDFIYYSSMSHSGCVSSPSLSGIFYLEIHKGRLVSKGVEDPSLFCHYVKCNEKFKSFKKKHQFIINSYITVRVNQSWVDVKVVECLSWCHAKVKVNGSDTVFNVNLNQVKVSM